MALAGLLFQLAASFGHVHAWPVSTGSDIFVPAPPAPGAPADTAEKCLVCLAASLAGHGALPAENVLATPVFSELAGLAFRDRATAARPPFINFLTRGPPSA